MLRVFLFHNNPVADAGYLGFPPITELNNVTALFEIILAWAEAHPEFFCEDFIFGQYSLIDFLPMESRHVTSNPLAIARPLSLSL